VGDRCAQLIVLPYPQVQTEEASELSETARGTGGFGSTGA
ncbi:MAG: dUTP diphosphatase, partial [Opitutales bacterium]|nr:dUTP diphosphatase [Opitutales bacterium]